jgi:ATP-dependent DNA helicase RecG
MRKALTAIDVALAKIESGVCADDLEGPTLDFKEQKSSVGDTEKQIAEAAICFANSAGGTIVLGVKDKVRGKDAFIGTTIEPNQLKQRIYQLSVPPLNVEVERHHKYENILLVNVPQSASIHADTQGRACRRINKSCQPMSPDEQSRLREERQGIDWSAQPSGIMPNELDASAILLAKKTLANFPDTRRSLAGLGDLPLSFSSTWS